MCYNSASLEEEGEAKLPAFEPGEKARTHAGRYQGKDSRLSLQEEKEFQVLFLSFKE